MGVEALLKRNDQNALLVHRGQRCVDPASEQVHSRRVILLTYAIETKQIGNENNVNIIEID